MKGKTTLKYLHHTLIKYVRGAYQKDTKIVKGFLCSIGFRSMEDELPYQGKEALTFNMQGSNESKAFYELLSLNKL